MLRHIGRRLLIAIPTLAQYGMNKPLGAQHVDDLGGVARGDQGPSLNYHRW